MSRLVFDSLQLSSLAVTRIRETRHRRRRQAHLAGLSALIFVLTIIAGRPADAAVITGTFTYDKVTNSTSGAIAARPIAFATVEVWYRDVNFWDIWSRIDDSAMTDANGLLRWGNDGRCRGTYALRVFAANGAAAVHQMDNLYTFWARPGSPGTEIQRTATSCGASLDFSFNFADPFTAFHFNIADTIRRGNDYANARRDLRESDSLPQATVQPTSVMPNSYYDPVVSTVFITSGGVTSDRTILHEYGHFLQSKVSTFAPIISNHDGCTATDAVFGHRINTSEHAWMEGFADYFAAAVNLSLPAGTLNMSSASRLESPSCGAVGLSAGPAGSPWTITASMIEDFVAGILWDLLDTPGDPGSTTEAFDVIRRQDARIFQVFDRELGHLGRWPSIFDFYCGWTDRGLSRVALDSLFVTRGIPKPACAAPLADSVVFRSSTGEWFNSTTRQSITRWGLPGDIPVPGFYDADGIPDPAVFRPSTGEWLINTRFNGVIVQQWGTSGDVPVPADYDADGRTDMAVWRPWTGEWFIINSSTGTVTGRQWGLQGDIPVPADYDLDGKADFAVWRPTGGMWHIVNSASGAVRSEQWGQPGDIPVPGDYDRDGRIDLAVFRPSAGTWFLANSSNAVRRGVAFGVFGDIPIPGDYDHDGQTDVALYRPATGVHFIIESSTGLLRSFQWGAPTDVPLPGGPRFQ